MPKTAENSGIDDTLQPLRSVELMTGLTGYNMIKGIRELQGLQDRATRCDHAIRMGVSPPRELVR
jgi:hypothetical protein